DPLNDRPLLHNESDLHPFGRLLDPGGRLGAEPAHVVDLAHIPLQLLARKLLARLRGDDLEDRVRADLLVTLDLDREDAVGLSIGGSGGQRGAQDAEGEAQERPEAVPAEYHQIEPPRGYNGAISSIVGSDLQISFQLAADHQPAAVDARLDR